LEILRVLWDRGPLPLGEICAAVRADREVATTTVATMLRLMLDKKLVHRKRAGRASRWSAAVSREKATGSMVSKLVDRVFDGSAQLLAAHLIEGEQLTGSELAELRKLIDQQGKGSAVSKRAHSKPSKRNGGKSK
jgi:predicted transcriptional regulator